MKTGDIMYWKTHSASDQKVRIDRISTVNTLVKVSLLEKPYLDRDYALVLKGELEELPIK